MKSRYSKTGGGSRFMKGSQKARTVYKRSSARRNKKRTKKTFAYKPTLLKGIVGARTDLLAPSGSTGARRVKRLYMKALIKRNPGHFLSTGKRTHEFSGEELPMYAQKIPCGDLESIMDLAKDGLFAMPNTQPTIYKRMTDLHTLELACIAFTKSSFTDIDERTQINVRAQTIPTGVTWDPRFASQDYFHRFGTISAPTETQLFALYKEVLGWVTKSHGLIEYIYGRGSVADAQIGQSLAPIRVDSMDAGLAFDAQSYKDAVVQQIGIFQKDITLELLKSYFNQHTLFGSWVEPIFRLATYARTQHMYMIHTANRVVSEGVDFDHFTTEEMDPKWRIENFKTRLVSALKLCGFNIPVADPNEIAPVDVRLSVGLERITGAVTAGELPAYYYQRDGQRTAASLSDTFGVRSALTAFSSTEKILASSQFVTQKRTTTAAASEKMYYQIHSLPAFTSPIFESDANLDGVIGDLSSATSKAEFQFLLDLFYGGNKSQFSISSEGGSKQTACTYMYSPQTPSCVLNTADGQDQTDATTLGGVKVKATDCSNLVSVSSPLILRQWINQQNVHLIEDQVDFDDDGNIMPNTLQQSSRTMLMNDGQRPESIRTSRSEINDIAKGDLDLEIPSDNSYARLYSHALSLHNLGFSMKVYTPQQFVQQFEGIQTSAAWYSRSGYTQVSGRMDIYLRPASILSDASLGDVDLGVMTNQQHAKAKQAFFTPSSAPLRNRRIDVQADNTPIYQQSSVLQASVSSLMMEFAPHGRFAQQPGIIADMKLANAAANLRQSTSQISNTVIAGLTSAYASHTSSQVFADNIEEITADQLDLNQKWHDGTNRVSLEQIIAMQQGQKYVPTTFFVDYNETEMLKAGIKVETVKKKAKTDKVVHVSPDVATLTVAAAMSIAKSLTKIQDSLAENFDSKQEIRGGGVTVQSYGERFYRAIITKRDKTSLKDPQKAQLFHLLAYSALKAVRLNVKYVEEESRSITTKEQLETFTRYLSMLAKIAQIKGRSTILIDVSIPKFKLKYFEYINSITVSHFDVGQAGGFDRDYGTALYARHHEIAYNTGIRAVNDVPINQYRLGIGVQLADGSLIPRQHISNPFTILAFYIDKLGYSASREKILRSIATPIVGMNGYLTTKSVYRRKAVVPGLHLLQFLKRGKQIQTLVQPYFSKFTMFSGLSGAGGIQGMIGETYAMQTGGDSYPAGRTQEVEEMRADSAQYLELPANIGKSPLAAASYKIAKLPVINLVAKNQIRLRHLFMQQTMHNVESNMPFGRTVARWHTFSDAVMLSGTFITTKVNVNDILPKSRMIYNYVPSQVAKGLPIVPLQEFTPYLSKVGMEYLDDFLKLNPESALQKLYTQSSLNSHFGTTDRFSNYGSEDFRLDALVASYRLRSLLIQKLRRDFEIDYHVTHALFKEKNLGHIQNLQYGEISNTQLRQLLAVAHAQKFIVPPPYARFQFMKDLNTRTGVQPINMTVLIDQPNNVPQKAASYRMTPELMSRWDLQTLYEQVIAAAARDMARTTNVQQMKVPLQLTLQPFFKNLLAKTSVTQGADYGSQYRMMTQSALLRSQFKKWVQAMMGNYKRYKGHPYWVDCYFGTFLSAGVDISPPAPQFFDYSQMDKSAADSLAGILFPQYEEDNTTTHNIKGVLSFAAVTRVKEQTTQKLDLLTLYTAFSGMFGQDIGKMQSQTWPSMQQEEQMDEGVVIRDPQKNYAYTGDLRAMTARFAANLKQIGLANNYDKVQQYKIYNPVYKKAEEFQQKYVTVSDPSGALFNTEMSLYDLPLLYTKQGGQSPQSTFVVNAINRRYQKRTTVDEIEKHRQEVVTWNHLSNGMLFDDNKSVENFWEKYLKEEDAPKYTSIPMTIIERITFYHVGPPRPLDEDAALAYKIYAAFSLMFKHYHTVLEVYVQVGYSKVSDYDLYVILCSMRTYLNNYIDYLRQMFPKFFDVLNLNNTFADDVLYSLNVEVPKYRVKKDKLPEEAELKLTGVRDRMTKQQAKIFTQLTRDPFIDKDQTVAFATRSLDEERLKTNQQYAVGRIQDNYKSVETLRDDIMGIIDGKTIVEVGERQQVTEQKLKLDAQVARKLKEALLSDNDEALMKGLKAAGISDSLTTQLQDGLKKLYDATHSSARPTPVYRTGQSGSAFTPVGQLRQAAYDSSKRAVQAAPPLPERQTLWLTNLLTEAKARNEELQRNAAMIQAERDAVARRTRLQVAQAAAEEEKDDANMVLQRPQVINTGLGGQLTESDQE